MRNNRKANRTVWKNILIYAIVGHMVLGLAACGGNSEDMPESFLGKDMEVEADGQNIQAASPAESAAVPTAKPEEPTAVPTEKPEEPAMYLDFCARKEQENREQMQAMLARARESVYDVLKAYDNAEMLGYSAPSTAEDIFADGVIDKICEGNSVAKAAVSEAVECFKSGEGLGSTFGKTMSAAVEAIPGAAKEKFVEMIVPECIRKMLHLYDTLEANSNLQVKYAINKLQDGFQRDTETLTAILLKEDLTGDELKRAASLISDIYDTVYELENRFQVSMAMDEWWFLDICLGGFADEYYRCDYLATEYRRAGGQGADPAAAAFTGTEEEVRALINERDFYYQDPENFVVQYSWLLGMKQSRVTLKYFDYVQLQKDSAENLVAGVLSNTFGNFITDMFAANKTGKDNIAVDVLYEYTDTCKQALDRHAGGVESLANIKLEMDTLYVELVNSEVADNDDMRCTLYFYQDYFGGELGPTYDFYRDRIQSCAGEITAYYQLLKSTSSGQKVLLSQEYLSNTAYLSELEKELKWIERSFYGENIPGMDFSVDIGSDTAAVSRAYSTALQYLCIDSMRVNDVYEEEYTVNVEGVGPLALTCYRKRGLISPYDVGSLEDVVIAIVLKSDDKTLLTCTYDCESEIKSAYTQDGTFAYYGIGEGRFGIVDCNLSEEENQLWGFYPLLAGGEIYMNVERTAEYMTLCVKN